MGKHIFSLLIVLLACLITRGQNPRNNYHEAIQSNEKKFTKNIGQYSSEIKYTCTIDGTDIRFLNNEISFGAIEETEIHSADPFPNVDALVWNLKFIHSEINPQIKTEDEAPGRINFIKGDIPQKNYSNVPQASSLSYLDIYPQTDLKYYIKNNRLKYDYILHPKAEISKIKMQYKGIEKLDISKTGKLQVHTAWGIIEEEAPYVYQIINNKIIDITAHYYLFNDSTFGFKLIGNYDFNYDLIIDPFTLTWSTYFKFPSSGILNYNHHITTDENGDIYLTGYSGNGLPTTPGVYKSVVGNGGLGSDMFVAKLNSSGTNLIFATYIGGYNSSMAGGTNIAVDNQGNAHIAGNISNISSTASFPVTPGAVHSTYQGGFTDGLYVVLNNTGTNLLYSTFLGGAQQDGCYDIEFDASYNVYISGTTESPGIATPGAYKTTYGGKNAANPFTAHNFNWATGDAFVMKFDNAFSQIYSTYIGGSNSEIGRSIFVETTGEVYLAGLTFSSNFPTTAGAYSTHLQNPASGTSDAFLIKLNAMGNALLYGTYIGGSFHDRAVDVAVKNGNIFLYGETKSNNFPVTPGAYMTILNGNDDAFVIKFSSSGNLLYSTLYGGNGIDEPYCIRVNCNEEVYISGSTASSDLPTNGAIKNIYSGNYDFYVAHIDKQGATVLNSTYMGGSGKDYRYPELVLKEYCTEDIIVAGGTTHSANFLTTPGAYQETKINANGDQPVVWKFSIPKLPLTTNNDTTICIGASVTLQASGANGTYTWSPATGLSNPFLQNPTANPGVTTKYYVRSSCDQCLDSVIVTVAPLITLSIQATNVMCNGIPTGSLTAAVTGGISPINYNWSGGLPNTSSQNNLPAGSYSLTITDQRGCSVTANTLITEPPRLIALIPNVQHINCYGETNGSAAATYLGGVQPVNYLWSNGSTLSHINNLAANNYNITVTDANGCSAAAAIQITQPSLIIPGISTNKHSICLGDNCSINTSVQGGTPPYLYLWNTSHTTSTLNIQPNSTITYSLSITDANGCKIQDTITIYVHPLPVIAFTSDTLSGCGPLCINFNNTTTNTQSLFWDFGDNSNSINSSVNHCYNDPGSYSVSLKVMDNKGCTNGITRNNMITVFPKPTALFSNNAHNTTITNPIVTFTDNSLNAVAWNWSFEESTGISSTLQNPIYQYNDTGTYKVTLYVFNEFGCKDTASDLIKINPDFLLHIPNTFTPNGDGKNDIFIPAGVGIETENYILYIYDRWGNLIFTTTQPNQGWDGHANNGSEIAQQDTYVWKAGFKDVLGKKHALTGHINLIR